ncbi:MAG: SOS response-associated peptidase family protein, partial [Acidimicrobiales bacterium]|nr:SOS response-associated peptidase family protein [Acidimicrobiales bacterium]
HDRMPVVLPPDAWEPWLDPTVDDMDLLQSFLVPAPNELITMHKVSTEVNSVRNKGAELVEPLPQ